MGLNIKSNNRKKGAEQRILQLGVTALRFEDFCECYAPHLIFLKQINIFKRKNSENVGNNEYF